MLNYKRPGGRQLDIMGEGEGVGKFCKQLKSVQTNVWKSSSLTNVSQPTTVLLRTTVTRTINQLQTWLTWVTTNNSHSQDYTNPDY